ncbi:MAG: DUF4292 domain-containing protein [Gemmatimonadaceae bacterium]|nr:DUF4292 domain-containing protein [Chitinophagaceae bacterium]
MKQIAILSLFLITLAAASCKSAKKIQSAITKKDTAQVVRMDSSRLDSIAFIHRILAGVQKNRIDNFKTFSAKIKVDYKDKDGQQPELTVFVRMEKDSLIWVSINATIFSYEALRVLITPDSIKVLNKKDKIVQLRSVSYLKELTQLPFDFSTLQDFLLGNPIYLDSNVVSYRKTETSINLMSIGDRFKHLLSVSVNEFLLQHSKLDDADPIRNRTCDLTYTNYEQKYGFQFATMRRASIAEKSRLDIDMDFKQYSFNETLSYPFAIPKNYKRQ